MECKQIKSRLRAVGSRESYKLPIGTKCACGIFVLKPRNSFNRYTQKINQTTRTIITDLCT